jgi:hypothetical protein
MPRSSARNVLFRTICDSSSRGGGRSIKELQMKEFIGLLVLVSVIAAPAFAPRCLSRCWFTKRHHHLLRYRSSVGPVDIWRAMLATFGVPAPIQISRLTRSIPLASPVSLAQRPAGGNDVPSAVRLVQLVSHPPNGWSVSLLIFRAPISMPRGPIISPASRNHYPRD